MTRGMILAGHESWGHPSLSRPVQGVSDWAPYLAYVDGDRFRELGRLSNAISENDECDELLALGEEL